MKTFVGSIAVLAAALFAGAWLLMITVGVLHHEWWPFIPTMSYKASLVISFVLMIRLMVGQVVGKVAEEVTR